jgi:hypothetical protein
MANWTYKEGADSEIIAKQITAQPLHRPELLQNYITLSWLGPAPLTFHTLGAMRVIFDMHQ